MYKYKKGIALVTTIMILLVLTLLATGLMFTIKNETAISMYQAHNVASVQVAEAALDEIKYRMKLKPGDNGFIGDTSNPLDINWTTYIVLNNREDTVGSEIYTQTLQKYISAGAGYDPSNPELDYSSDIGSGSADNATLKIYHKRNEAGDQIYFFDSKSQRQFLGPPSLVTQYPPVEIIEITANVGKATKKILAEISKQTVKIEAQSALSTASLAWEGIGSSETRLCGHNHKMSTPWGTPGPGGTDPTYPYADTTISNSCWYASGGVPQYHVMTRYDAAHHPTNNHFLYNPVSSSMDFYHLEFDEYCSEVGCVAAAATQGTASQIHGNASGRIFGNPDVIVRSDITIPDLWDLLDYSTKTEMLNDASLDWGTDLTQYSGADEYHYYYLKNTAGIIQLPINAHTITQTMGIIYVDDSLQILQGGGANNCAFMHKGLLYVEYDVIEGGNGGAYDFWILGAMMVKGKMTGTKAGITKFTWLFSSDALGNPVEDKKSYYKILGWKEQN